MYPIYLYSLYFSVYTQGVYEHISVCILYKHKYECEHTLPRALKWLVGRVNTNSSPAID